MFFGTGSLFAHYIGIDYSGTQMPTTSLKGLRIYLADRKASPIEVLPPLSFRKYWTRRGIAERLIERLTEAVPTIVGIDQGFSFPMHYFEVHHLLPDWPSFLGLQRDAQDFSGTGRISLADKETMVKLIVNLINSRN